MRTCKFNRIFPLVVLLFGTLFSSCSSIGRVFWYNVPGAGDYKIFASRQVKGDSLRTRTIPESSLQELPDIKTWAAGKASKKVVAPEELFQKTGTIAFLVIQKGQMQYEWYRKGYDSSAVYTSFSLSKIMLSSLVGIALEDGKIKSLDQPVSDFLGSFRESGLDKVSLRHLLQMTSGLKSSESPVNPFSRLARMYYGRNLDRELRNFDLEYQPGEKFKYLSLNTQVLSQVLISVYDKPLAELFSEKIWSRMGSLKDGSWSLDKKDGMEKAFCCFNFHARDMARYGMLLLDDGVYKGDTIIPPDWIHTVMKLDTLGGSTQNYQMYWYTSAEQEDIFGQGLLGQFLYIAPETETVILRLGKKIEFSPWYAMFKYLSGTDYHPGEMPMSRSDLRKYEGNYVFYQSLNGDSALIGKGVRISARSGYLKVNPEFRSAVKMVPVSDGLFYNYGDGRKMCFHFNAEGKVEKFEWTRLGNSWELVPASK